jgi:hypothetical protein
VLQEHDAGTKKDMGDLVQVPPDGVSMLAGTSDEYTTLTIYQIINLPTSGGLFEVRRIERAMNGVKTAIEDHTVALRILQIQNQAWATGQQRHGLGQQKLVTILTDTESLMDPLMEQCAPEHTDPTRRLEAVVPPLGDSFHDNANLVTVSLDNLKLTFDPRTVKDPPTVSFAHDIELLIKEWHCSDRLIVAGQKIPIRHWNAFYMASAKIKPKAWATFRGTWNNWKVQSYQVHLTAGFADLAISWTCKFIVNEYESFTSPDAFWAEYQKDGKRMNYQAILDALKIRRKAADEKNEEKNASDAADARQYYGDLAHAPDRTFEYRKTGKWRVYLKNQDIGPRWRKLLADREDIQAEWLRIKSTTSRAL